MNFPLSPKNKFVRVTHDDFYSAEIHQLTSAPARSQQACAYDMDDVDLAWLNRVNMHRTAVGSSKVSELSFEQTMEELERQSWANMQTLLKTEEFLELEYDENVICDVCRAVIWSTYPIPPSPLSLLLILFIDMKLTLKLTLKLI